MALVIGVGYLLLGALRWNPFRSTYLATVELPASGGLLVNQDVTLRGVPIGKVTKLSIVPDGVNAEVRLNSATGFQVHQGPGRRPLGGRRAVHRLRRR